MNTLNDVFLNFLKEQKREKESLSHEIIVSKSRINLSCIVRIQLKGRVSFQWGRQRTNYWNTFFHLSSDSIFPQIPSSRYTLHLPNTQPIPFAELTVSIILESTGNYISMTYAVSLSSHYHPPSNGWQKLIICRHFKTEYGVRIRRGSATGAYWSHPWTVWKKKGTSWC